MLTRPQIALLAAFGAIAPLSIDMYLPAMPQIASELSVSAQQAGQSVSVFFSGIALGQLVAGPLSDRFGRRSVILVGILLYIAGSVAALLTASFPLLLGARIAQALGACAIMVAGRSVVRDRLDHVESARLFSLLALIGGLAPVLAPSMGNLIMAFAEWRGIFLVMAITGGLVLMATLVLLPESRSDATRQQAISENPFSAYAALLRQKMILGTILAAGLNSACMFAYIANSPAVLMDGYGVSPTNFGFLFAMNSAGLVAANQLNRVLLKTRTPEKVLRGSARNALVFAVLFGLFAATAWGGLVALLVLLFLVIGSAAIIQANTMASAMSVDQSRTGSTAALFGAVTFGAGSLFSWVAGLVHTPDGRGLASVIGVCLIGFAATMFWILRDHPAPEEQAG